MLKAVELEFYATLVKEIVHNDSDWGSMCRVCVIDDGAWQKQRQRRERTGLEFLDQTHVENRQRGIDFEISKEVSVCRGSVDCVLFKKEEWERNGQTPDAGG